MWGIPVAPQRFPGFDSHSNRGVMAFMCMLMTNVENLVTCSFVIHVSSWVNWLFKFFVKAQGLFEGGELDNLSDYLGFCHPSRVPVLSDLHVNFLLAAF